jgi:hypothetical protein
MEELFPGVPAGQVVAVAPAATHHSVDQLLRGGNDAHGLADLSHFQEAECGGEGALWEAQPQTVSEGAKSGRLVYLAGPAAAQLGVSVNDALVEAGVAPAVVGGMQAQ